MNNGRLLRACFVRALWCAVSTVTVACATVPTHAPVLSGDSSLGADDFNRGMQAARKQQWQAAEALFRSAMQLDPKLDIASVNLGIALERQGKLQAALVVYDSVYHRGLNSTIFVKHYVRALVLHEKWKQARTILNQALKIKPNDLSLLNLMSNVWRHQGEYHQAIRVARQVLLQEQNNVAAIKTMAMTYADQGKLDLAGSFFLKAQQLAPKDASILTALGVVYFRRNQHQRALQAFEKSVALSPQDVIAHVNIGAIALRYRDYARAEKSFTHAISHGSSTCLTMSGLGYALEGQQKFQAAVTQLQLTQKRCPQETGILFQLGLICMEQLRDTACATKHFKAYANQSNALPKDPVFEHLKLLEEMKQDNAKDDA